MELDLDFFHCKTGADFEQAVAELLVNCGINAATTGKNDNGVDVVAECIMKEKHFSHKYYIQCKLWNNTVGLHPIQEVYAGCHYFGNDGTPVVFTTARVTVAARVYAKKLGVEVIGDAELQELKRSRIEKRPVNPNSIGLHRLLMSKIGNDFSFANKVLDEPVQEPDTVEQLESTLKDDFDNAIEYTKEAARLQQEAAYCTEKALTLQKEALLRNLKYG